jgi:hypothetical protein
MVSFCVKIQGNCIHILSPPQAVYNCLHIGNIRAKSGEEKHNAMQQISYSELFFAPPPKESSTSGFRFFDLLAVKDEGSHV